ncbi:hypothetical protein PGT21_005419 [Puccinia graminis f. sp. tritici]|uniref:Uncharacterized protein n=1 Tax=Puccinia graminis f. sp. tritici TaxID=56615 RepID=A0A5B0M508_PUCGR|nr:hypothetical protein PGT21_005419 [Puccinia graminis f. sp. tritici]KAA1123154.1 hypothetical protein PGTUg99_016827 [Puccinia graminis f. sp. tritici]
MVWCCKRVWAQAPVPRVLAPPGPGPAPRGLDLAGRAGVGPWHWPKSGLAEPKLRAHQITNIDTTTTKPATHLADLAPSTQRLGSKSPLFNFIYPQPQGPAFKPQPRQQSLTPLSTTSSTTTSSSTITINTFNRYTNHSTASSRTILYHDI